MFSVLAELNQNILTSVNGLAGHWPILDRLGIFFAEYLQYVLGLLLLAVIVFSKERTKRLFMAAAAVLAALLARFAVKGLILMFYSNPRPYAGNFSARQLVSTPGEDFQSFPSGHALFFFAAATAIYCYDKKLGMVFYTAAILISFARIFVGVHWPSDILAGAILGIITGLLTYKAAKFLKK
ncbi:MAG TPA: phosphatase PAP2 family protein [Candidatus Paceibacterota bacterium]|nr:phosphatase PAP2 family protein [Candidatus Pacearchaeota archaeon]HRZ50917.1 phosphatase PAP2 family protein [Candidatus Paceibacterota bacterium]HSA36638.1 phosphatase PAP2 family protein [Candidatus Paceibacterota bacterium]